MGHHFLDKLAVIPTGIDLTGIAYSISRWFLTKSCQRIVVDMGLETLIGVEFQGKFGRGGAPSLRMGVSQLIMNRWNRWNHWNRISLVITAREGFMIGLFIDLRFCGRNRCAASLRDRQAAILGYMIGSSPSLGLFRVQLSDY